MAWKLVSRLEPTTTCQVLIEAAAQLPVMDEPATVYADSGVENVNGEVDELLGLGKLRRVLAQVEVSFSNSLVEAFWRSLKSNVRLRPLAVRGNRDSRCDDTTDRVDNPDAASRFGIDHRRFDTTGPPRLAGSDSSQCDP